jgi:hypothetical protein
MQARAEALPSGRSIFNCICTALYLHRPKECATETPASSNVDEEILRLVLRALESNFLLDDEELLYDQDDEIIVGDHQFSIDEVTFPGESESQSRKIAVQTFLADQCRKAYEHLNTHQEDALGKPDKKRTLLLKWRTDWSRCLRRSEIQRIELLHFCHRMLGDNTLVCRLVGAIPKRPNSHFCEAWRKLYLAERNRQAKKAKRPFRGRAPASLYRFERWLLRNWGNPHLPLCLMKLEDIRAQVRSAPEFRHETADESPAQYVTAETIRKFAKRAGLSRSCKLYRHWR